MMSGISAASDIPADISAASMLSNTSDIPADISAASVLSKRDADAQFYQTNNGGVSNNYDCKNGGCSRSEYYQQFHAGSQALNVDF